MLSGVLADAASGYFVFIPFTIAAKCLLGLGAGLFRNHKIMKYLSPVLGCAFEVLILFLLSFLSQLLKRMSIAIINAYNTSDVV